MNDKGQVYIVTGSAGEASDRAEWLVAAFSEEERASLFAEVCRRKARDAYAALRDARRTVLIHNREQQQRPTREHFNASLNEWVPPSLRADFLPWPEGDAFRFPEDPRGEITESTEYGVEMIPLDSEASNVSEPEQLKILSLEEVRAIVADKTVQPSATLVDRLCVTVERCTEQSDTLARESAGVAARNVHLRADVQDLKAENARLSALVARMRDDLENIQGETEMVDEYAPAVVLSSIESLCKAALSDPDGQCAAEELRLLRNWEAANAGLNNAKLSETHEAAMIREEEAWTALVEFRERQKGAPS